MCIHYFKAGETLERLRFNGFAHSTWTPRRFGGHGMEEAGILMRHFRNLPLLLDISQ